MTARLQGARHCQRRPVVTDYRAVMDLVLKGWSVRLIRTTVGCSHTTVSHRPRHQRSHRGANRPESDPGPGVPVVRQRADHGQARQARPRRSLPQPHRCQRCWPGSELHRGEEHDGRGTKGPSHPPTGTTKPVRDISTPTSGTTYAPARDTRGAYLGGAAQFSLEDLSKKGPAQ